MKNIFLNFFLILFLTGCAAPGTALLSPVITGAKTKSAHQASLSLASSLSSNQIIRNYQDEILDVKEDVINKVNNIVLSETLLDRKINKSANLESNKTPIILASYSVDSIEISEVIEPEPLP